MYPVVSGIWICRPSLFVHNIRFSVIHNKQSILLNVCPSVMGTSNRVVSIDILKDHERWLNLRVLTTSQPNSHSHSLNSTSEACVLNSFITGEYQCLSVVKFDNKVVLICVTHIFFFIFVGPNSFAKSSRISRYLLFQL